MNDTAITAQSLGRVVVLMGGHSSERAISIQSGTGVLNALLSVGVDAVAFDPATQAIDALVALKADRAMLCLHGRWGEDGCVQGVLEMLRLPYTGSGVMASAIAMDKVTTKRLWLAEGLPTPAYRRVSTIEALTAACHDIGFKLGHSVAVKPACEGSSLGFTHVTQAGDIQTAWDKSAALKSHQRIDLIVEQFVAGRELTVAVLQTNGISKALPIVEIIAPKGNYDYENKYFKDDTQYICPAQVNQELTTRIQQLAEQAFDSVGCAGWGRVDVMLDAASQSPYLLEVNTTPGMTSHSLVPMAAKATGLSYPALCVQLAAGAALKV